MARDLVNELLEVKSREGGRRSASSAGVSAIDELKALWPSKVGRLTAVADFFPVRIVTILEVFTRRWLEKLIDHGPPYLEHAAVLIHGGAKFDYAATVAIQGKRVSLGQLVAHNVSLNDPGQIVTCFTKVLGSDFLKAIGQTHDRFAVERQGAPKVPIISNVDTMMATLARLFAARHILVHETPSVRPYEHADVDAFLAAAREFAHATEQTLYGRLFPDYPLTTLDMVEEAGRALYAAQQEQEDVLAKVKPLISDPLERDFLRRSQEAWTTYRDLQADLRACNLEGGSLQPWIRIQELTRLTTVRTEELRWWIDREEGDI